MASLHCILAGLRQCANAFRLKPKVSRRKLKEKTNTARIARPTLEIKSHNTLCRLLLLPRVTTRTRTSVNESQNAFFFVITENHKQMYAVCRQSVQRSCTVHTAGKCTGRAVVLSSFGLWERGKKIRNQ